MVQRPLCGARLLAFALLLTTLSRAPLASATTREPRAPVPRGWQQTRALRSGTRAFAGTAFLVSALGWWAFSRNLKRRVAEREREELLQTELLELERELERPAPFIPQQPAFPKLEPDTLTLAPVGDISRASALLSSTRLSRDER